MTEKPDDFAEYSEHIQYPEGALPEDVVKWFDNVFSDWMSKPGDYTSSGLLKAIRELSQRGWQFKLTLLPGGVPEDVPTVQRELPDGGGIVHDINVKGIGFADRDNQYFIGLTQNYVSLSRYREGLIKAFAPEDIFELQAKSPFESAPLKT